MILQNLTAYNAKVTASQTSYDLTGKIADLKMVNSFTLNLELKNASRSLTFEVAIANANKLEVTLKNAVGVKELLPLVGQTFDLTRLR